MTQKQIQTLLEKEYGHQKPFLHNFTPRDMVAFGEKVAKACKSKHK